MASPFSLGLPTLGRPLLRARLAFIMAAAAEILANLEKHLKVAAAVGSATVDGFTVSYGDLEKRYKFWKSQAAREAGNRPRAAQINLSG